MKTLVVKYLPSGNNSNTLNLLELFLKAAAGQKIETVDLLETPAPIFDQNSIQAYYKRNYGKQQLNETESKLLAKNDQLIAQLKSADVLVIACPMHNFGFPAAVKAYLDAVIFNGETFEMGKKLMAGKKALTLFTAGGIYDDKVVDLNYPHWNTLALGAKINFNFMGYDESEVIGTSLRDEKTRPEHLSEANQKISQLVKRWYA